MAKLPGAEFFCTCTSHMAGKEVFGFQKRKADISLSYEGESHRPNKVNFFHPQTMTKSSRAKHASCSLSNILEELSPKLQEDQALNNLGTASDIGRPGHVTAIHETTCGTSQGCPRLQQKLALPSKQLPRRSARLGLFKATPTTTPTYIGIMQHAHKKKPEVMEFFFFYDYIERCIKGTRRKWVESRPDIPSIWPVKIKTNLSTKEILDLESIRFQLP